MIIRICEYCGSRKPHFAKSLCEKCYYKKHREMNRERMKLRDQKYYRKNREKVLATNKKWRENHKEKMREYKKKWYQENKERILKNWKEYRERNKEKIKEQNRVYWRRTEVKIKDRLRKRIKRYGGCFARNATKTIELANHKCMGCGLYDDKKVFNVHHIVPFALIRNNDLWNLEYLCKACHIQREKYFKKLAERIGIVIPTLKNLSRLDSGE